MTNQPKQPRPDDAVLGGQSIAPAGAVVLGGIEGVRMRLASNNLEEKKAAIVQALNYGEEGLAVLFEVLEQENLEDVWWLARQVLEKYGDPVIQAKLESYYHWYDYESVMVNRQGKIIKRRPGRASYYREDLGNGIYLDMVYIAGGSFLMGAPESEQKSDDNERPQHQVTVPSFWMGKYPVTQEQWQAVMGHNPSHFKGDNRPVEQVGWADCQEFCRQLSERTGKYYRLPSEAEWEYACRAGTITPFNCGETITTKLARYDGDYTYAGEGGQYGYREETVEVGHFPPNMWGLYDMHGNVWERCEDSWHNDYNGVPTDGSAWTDHHSQTDRCVIRGGSWTNTPGACRSGSRGYNYLDKSFETMGLRLVLL